MTVATDSAPLLQIENLRVYYWSQAGPVKAVDDIYILYGGSVMESGDIEGVIQNPHHPYTQLLVGSITLPDPDVRWEGRSASAASEETAAINLEGCKFYHRSTHAMERCATGTPLDDTVAPDQTASCFLFE